MIDKIKTFISKSYGWALALGALVSILFFIIIPFTETINNLTIDKKDLIAANTSLQTKVELNQKEVDYYKQEHEKLLEQLNKKEVEIIEKEKIVYKDGKLIIPEDYEDLKSNYSSLSELYTEKSDMYDKVKDSLEDANKVINDQSIIIEDLKDMNKELLKALNKKEPFGQIIKAGLGTDFTNIDYRAGYQIILFEKVSLEIQVQLPNPSASVLVGIKL